MTTTIHPTKTQFEDLSNEIIYEIFDFLDMYHVYDAFHDLNIRLYTLLSCSNLPLHINMSFLSKSNFQRYLVQFVLPNSDRISSLHLRTRSMFDQIFSSSENIKKFSGVKTILLDNMTSLDHLTCLTSLPKLSSIVITRSDRTTMEDIVCHPILYLPTLKYCKISLEETLRYESLPGSSSRLSTIEHLVINSGCSIHDFLYLLSCLPHLRRLSIDYLYYSHDWGRRTISPVCNQLTHVSLKLKHIPFDRFEQILIDFLAGIYVLRISADNDREYLSADRWERVISSSMSNLRTFDSQHTCYIRDDIDQLAYEDLIRQFNSPFWINRQWYFAYQHGGGNGLRNYAMFYSIQPYRRRSYVLYGKHHQIRPPTSDYQLVHHVHIDNQSAMNDCSIFFPNARQLTLSSDICALPVYSFTTALNRVVPLKQLQKIIIDCTVLRLDTFVHILYSTPNCSQLILTYGLSDKRDFLPTACNTRFRTTADMNKITDLIVKSICTLEQVKLLTKLCRQIQHLTIEVLHKELNSILKYLLAKSNKYTRQLITLHIKSTSDIYIEKITNELELLRPSKEFAVEDVGYSTCYIWW